MIVSPGSRCGTSSAITESTIPAGTISQTERGASSCPASSSSESAVDSTVVSYVCTSMPAPRRRSVMFAPIRPSPTIPSWTVAEAFIFVTPLSPDTGPARPYANVPRLTSASSASFPQLELVLDVRDVDARHREQDVEVEEHVGGLRDEPAVLRRGGDRGLDRLLAELLRSALHAGLRERGDIRPFGAVAHPLDDRSPERRREARPRARVAGRPCGSNPQEERVAVAVVPQLLDGEHVPRGLALAPQLLTRTAPEPGFARLPGQAQRLVVHPREHQNPPVSRVLDDRGAELRSHHEAKR